MPLPDTKVITKRINRMRSIGMGVATSVAIMAIVFSFRTTSALDSEAAVRINVAGKQRMLAQRILTDAFKVDNYIRVGEWNKLEPTLAELQASKAEFKEAHSALYNSKTLSKVPTHKTTAFQDAFLIADRSAKSLILASNDLEKLTASIIRRAPYIDEHVFKQTAAAKNDIAEIHGVFFPKMNAIVALYEQRSKADAAIIIKRSRTSTFVLIGVMAGISLFLIEPTFLIVRKQIVDLSNIINKAKRANAIRWRLLTNIGNESRPLITQITNMANLLNEDSLSESERMRLVSLIHQSTNDLTVLSETMLDLSAIESEHLRILNEQFDLHGLLEHVTQDSKTRAACKELTLSLLIDDSCPTLITTDPKRLEQVLHKLIDNAISFTQSGRIIISAKLLDKGDSRLLELSVTDTGRGIDEQTQADIFDTTQQAQDALTQGIISSGLGLSISNEIAKELGGDLWIQSTSSKGTTFVFTLNPGVYDYTSTDQDNHQTAHELKPLAERKLLIVDDSEGSSILLEFMLNQAGAVIEFVTSASAAIERIEASQRQNTPYELIITDMQMDAYKGYFTVIKLRDHGISIPIIALSACDDHNDRQDSINAGCNESVPKPISKDLLVEACLRHLTPHHAKRAA